MKVSKYIYNFLKNKQINHVFGYSGGAVLPLLNEFRNNNIKFIKNSTEQCSGFLAEGYSKSQGLKVPGVVITTSGPGITNVITPLQNAYSDGSPLIVISGQVPTNALGTDAFQECPATKLTKHCTKWNKLILNKEEIIESMNIAYNISMSCRKGPVHIDIPKDILLETINIENVILNNGNYFNNDDTKRVYCNDSNRYYNINNYRYDEYSGLNINNNVNKIVDLLNKSNNPIIILGQGSNNISNELNDFINKYNIPVTTTLHGMGVVNEKNKLSLEMHGMHGKPVANYAIQNSDLVIGIGNRFDDRTIGNLKKYANNALNNYGIVHIDSSSDQINKVCKLFDANKLISINCNSKYFIDILNNKNIIKKNDDWINKLIKYSKNNNYYYNKSNTDLKGPDIIKSIDKNIDELKICRNNIIFTTGVGNHQMWTSQYITWTHPNKLITSGSLGTMGVGVPFAIGSKLANPDKMVICIDGDSSFNMTSNELQTILENNIPIKIAIINDSRQQMVYVWQKLFHNNNIVATENINPDYELLAKAYNLNVVKCSNINDLDKKVKSFLNMKGPVLGIFNVKPEMCYPLVSPGNSLDDMIKNENDINNINKNVNAPN